MNSLSSSKHGLLAKEDSLLVIIDMQERLVPAMAEKEGLVENVLRLVKVSRILGIPVILTEQQKLGDTLPEIRDEIENASPISKLEFNCFGSEDFTENVRQLKRKTLIIAGIEAHICVAQTALHACSEYDVHVVSDALSSRSPHNCSVAVNRMAQSGITITSTEMVIYELLGKAGTDTFREVLKLVK